MKRKVILTLIIVIFLISLQVNNKIFAIDTNSINLTTETNTDEKK